MMEEESLDKATLGVTESGAEVLEKIMTRPDLFATEAAAFKSAVALALSLGLEPTGDPIRIRTKWSLGGIMNDLAEMVSWYADTETPVDMANRLADAGLAHLADLVDLGAPVGALFSLQPSPGENI